MKDCKNYYQVSSTVSDKNEKKNLTWLKLSFTGEELCHKELSFLISDIGKCDSLEFLDLKFKHAENLKRKSLEMLKPRFGTSASLRNLVLRFEGLPWEITEEIKEKLFSDIMDGWQSSLKNLKDILIMDEDVQHILNV